MDILSGLFRKQTIGEKAGKEEKNGYVFFTKKDDYCRISPFKKLCSHHVLWKHENSLGVFMTPF
jgi:hypothetical protein